MAEDSNSKSVFQAGIKWKPLMQAEYPMWGLDYERFNYWLKWMEHWAAVVNSKEAATLEELQNYFSTLNVLYKEWRAIIAIAETTKNYDSYMTEAKLLKRRLERESSNGLPINKIVIQKLTDTLDKIHTELMELKQLIGLGIPVRKNIKFKDKIKLGMGTSKRAMELPADIE